MRVSFKKQAVGDIDFGIVYGCIALLILCAGHFLPVCTFFPDCVFHSLTGIPCPTCGSTRAIEQMSHGNVSASIASNPLIALCFMAALLCFLYSVAARVCGFSRISIACTDSEKNIFSATAFFIVLTNWLYLIITL